MVFGLIVARFKPNGNTSMAEAMGNAQIEDSDDDIPLFPCLPDSDDEPLFPGPIVPLNPAPPLPQEPLFHHHHLLHGEPLVLVVIEPVPLIVVPFGDMPELVPDSDDDEMVAESDDEDEAMPPLIPDDNDENEYDHIDNRAIDVTLDMPSANPNIMNVTSRHQDKYANLSC